MKINQIDTVCYIVGILYPEYEIVVYFSAYGEISSVFEPDVKMTHLPLAAAKFKTAENATKLARNFENSVVHKLTISGQVEDLITTELKVAE